MNKIYTRGGDKGQTGLFSGPRVSKNDPLIHALGCVDELNTIIPEARATDLQVEFVKLFTRDLPYLPLYYRLEWLAIRKGVTGITPRIESGGQNMNTWNMHLWDKI